jgi:hypothetical protein
MPVWCSTEASVAYCPTKEHSLEWQIAVEGLEHGKRAVTCLKRTQTQKWAEKFLNKEWLPMNEEAACKKTVTHFWYRLHLWQLFLLRILTEVFLNLPGVFLSLTEVLPCFFLSCKANARVKLAKTGHGPHSSTLVVIFVILCIVCA